MKRYSTRPLGLFPENSVVRISVDHVRILRRCLDHPEGIPQKQLCQDLKLSDSQLSKRKDGLIRLGLLRERHTLNSKELSIKAYKVNQARELVGQMLLLQKTVMLRPHRLWVKGYMIGHYGKMDKIIRNLKKRYMILDSPMKNNTEHTVIMEDGKVMLYDHGPLIQFHLYGLYLSVQEQDIELVSDYVKSIIQDRLERMIDTMQEGLSEVGVKIENNIFLKPMHLGILCKKDAADAIRTAEKLKAYSLTPDKSLRELIEYETNGNLDAVLNRITGALREMFNKE